MQVRWSRSPLRVGLVVCMIAVSATAATAATAAAGDSPQVIRVDGGREDRLGGVAVDAAGNTYFGAQMTSPNTGVTFSVVKLDPRGAPIWRSTYGGSRGGVLGQAVAVAVDGAGNVYAAGWISDSTGVGAGTDSLLLKLNRDGVEQWARRFDNGGLDRAGRVAVDQSGAVYVSGDSMSSRFDWVTQRFAADGTVQWTRRHSGPGSADDHVGDMALAPNGNVVVTGIVKNNGDGVTNDIELLTYDPQGATVWRRQFTVTNISDELARDMDIDAAGRITVTGSTAQNASPEFGVPKPITLRYDASGTLLHTVPDGGGAVDVDAAGNAYLVGFFGAPDTSATAKYDSAGDRVWRTPLSLGSGDILVVTAAAVDSAGVVTVAATRTDATTLNADYLTIRYAADGRELWRHRFNGTGDGADRVAGLVVDGRDAALVAGTSWSDFVSSGGTDDDLLALRFPAGVAPSHGAPPAAPDRLTAASPARSQIRLDWRDNAGDEAGFRIERCRGAGCAAFTEIAAVGPNVVTFLDGGLTRNTSYTYRVRAVNADGDSPFSTTATTRTRRS